MRMLVGLMAGLGAAVRIEAQVVEGRVLLPDRLGPAAGAVVTAVDQSGAIVARTVSNGRGAYLLRLAAPAIVRIRAVQLGMSPGQSDSMSAEAGQRYELIITLGTRVLELPAVLASAQSNCRIEGSAREKLIQRWQGARMALNASGVADDSAISQVLLFDRTQGNQGNRDVREDPATTSVLVTQGFFADTPVETLLTSGFVRMRSDNRVVFDVPNAATVLSDGFAMTHCLEPRDPTLFGRDMVGIDFSPVSDVDTVADVAGTLWLDRETAEPRRLDFRYTNLRHYETRERCHSGSIDRCMAASGPHPGNGSLTFARLPSGKLFVSSWWFQPTNEKAPLRKGFNSMRTPQGEWVSCRLSQPGCKQVGVLSFRTAETVGMVMQVTSPDRALYRSAEAAAMAGRLSREHAGQWPASIRGVVSAADGVTRLRAIVEVDNPVRAAVTDERGFFDLGPIVAMPVRLSIRAAGYESVSFRLQLIHDSTRSVRAMLQPVPNRAGMRP